MKRLTLIFTLLIAAPLFTVLNGQTPEIDSLENLLQEHKRLDTVRVCLLNKIASINVSSRPEKALQYAQEAEKLAEKLFFKKGKAESLLQIGKFYYYKSDYQKAITYYQKSLQVNNELGEKQKTSRCIISIGIAHKKLGNYKQAIEHYQKALKINEELQNKSGASNNLNSIGVLYSDQGNYLKALEYYQKSLKIEEELKDSLDISMRINNIGTIYLLTKNYSKALEYYQKSLKIKEELKDSLGISSSINNIGIIYLYSSDYSKALEYFQKSLHIEIKLGSNQSIANTYNNIGELYQFTGKYQKSLEYYQKSFEIAEVIGSEYVICITNFNMGAVYLKSNNYTKALIYTNKSLQKAKELELIDNQRDAYKQLSEIYSATKKYKKAYNYQILYIELNDSIFNEKNIKKITSLELNYEFEKEKQITELKQQKKDAVTLEEIKYQKTIRNVFITGLLVALLIILLFYRTVRIKKKANNLLRQKNEEIILQKDQIYDQKSEIEVQAEELAAQKDNLEEIVEQRTAAFVKAKERAEESDQLKTAFLNNISHEFRTPMNGILGFSSLLIKPGLSGDNQKKYAEIISKSGNQLLNIVNDTVEISKIHSKQAKITKSLVNISSLVSETVSEFKESVLLKGIDISLELKLGKEQLLTEIDESKIERILWHLIDNAVKFTFGGHIKIMGQTAVNNQIQFQIEDTGIGIPPQLHEKIFDPFRQVESGSARNFGGNGIGLSLAKAYVEMLGGKIWLKSQVEKGTTVFFTIPIQKSTKTETKKQITATGDINYKTILIVEDNELNYLLLEEILSNYNIKLLHAWNGKEAFSMFAREKHIDLILMDLKMPVMDGYEALNQIRSINPKVPIIAQTAYASDTDKDEISSAGFDDYISKPINEDKLVEILKQRI